MGFPAYLSYRMRRVGWQASDRVVVERVPWSAGEHHLTDIYRCFQARWAKKLSWAEVARSFRTCWDQVYRSVRHVVEYGLAHRRLDQVTALGVDEIQFGRGSRCLALVYQIDTHCLECAARGPAGPLDPAPRDWQVVNAEVYAFLGTRLAKLTGVT